MQIRKGSHSIFSVRLHFVFVTRYRRKAITDKMLKRIGEMFEQVCLKLDCQIIEFNGEPDHVHLLVDFHPKNSIAKLVACLKAATSRMVKKEFPDQYKRWYSTPSFWSGSYYVASTGGAPIEKIKQYIQSQESP